MNIFQCQDQASRLFLWGGIWWLCISHSCFIAFLSHSRSQEPHPDMKYTDLHVIRDPGPWALCRNSMRHGGCLLWGKVDFHPHMRKTRLMLGWAKTQLFDCLIFIFLFLTTEPWALCADKDKGVNWDLNKCCVKIQICPPPPPPCASSFLMPRVSENVIVCQESPNTPSDLLICQKDSQDPVLIFMVTVYYSKMT